MFPSLPGYRFERELGRGAMGVVYLGQRENDGLPIAIKTIKAAVVPSEEAVRRFLREAEILKQLDHPHIVAFHEMGQVAGLLYFVMDFVEGSNAHSLLEREGPLPVPRAVRLICQLLEGLAYAHVQGFVQRDVKPANLLVNGPREALNCYLTDFGLARAYQGSQLSGLTVAGTVAGTPGFMAPEQVMDFHSATPPADQYAAAATLYRLLTNQPLYDGLKNNVFELFRKVLEEEPVPIQQRRPDLPAELTQVIHRALAHKASDRFPDVSAFRAALLPFAE